MENNKYFKISIFIALFSLAVFAATGFLGYRAYTSSKKNEKEYKDSIQVLKHDIRRLDARLTAIDKRIAASGDRPLAASAYNPETENSTAGEAGGGSPVAKPDELMRLKQMVESTGREQLRLKQIVKSTGLELLAANEDINPELLKEIYDNQAERNEIDSRRAYLRETNSELHRADDMQYDEELNTLYQRARLRGRRDVSRQDRDKAFEEMLEKYPEAYATGMVVAERALFSAFRRNNAEVEKYYKLLSENEGFSNLVTDRGIEAVPNIEYYLTRQYLRDGRTGDAHLLLESLEKNYPDSLLFVRRRGRGAGWQSVSREVPRLLGNLNQ